MEGMIMFEVGYQILKEFGSLTLMVLPYFILGTAFGALVEVYLKPGFAMKYLNKGSSSVIYASILGAVLPGCACTVVPMADGLKRKGARLGTVSAFIMVAPLLSPHTVVLTYGLLGLKFTLARLAFSLSGAIILGLLYNYLEKKGIKGFSLHIKSNDGNSCACCLPEDKVEKRGFWKAFITISGDLGKYFLLGMFIASLMTVLIPIDAIPRYIGSSGMFAYLVAALIGVPVYICEGEEIPITLSLLKLGLGQGPSLTFLLGAVGTCIPTMLMAQKIIGKRPTLFYILSWFVFVIGAGWLFSLLW
jgi:uncharacterized membrane protein YraQ (UPF0718 family)